jgi:uncharacterized HAD superfamily protein
MKKLPKIKEKAILVDIDGTLADESKRHGYAKMGNGKIDWEKYFDDKMLLQDKVNIPLKKRILKYKKEGYKVIILTGRPIKYEKQTKKWLTKNKIPYDKLVMREVGHYTKTTEYKSKEISKLKKDYVFEIAFEDLGSGIKALEIQKVPYEKIYFKG